MLLGHSKIKPPSLAARRWRRAVTPPTSHFASRARTRSLKLPRAGFDELEIDWGPDEPFGPDDDPGTPMTHQDSSESDELRPDLFAPGAAPLPAPEPGLLSEAGRRHAWEHARRRRRLRITRHGRVRPHRRSRRPGPLRRGPGGEFLAVGRATRWRLSIQTNSLA